MADSQGSPKHHRRRISCEMVADEIPRASCCSGRRQEAFESCDSCFHPLSREVFPQARLVAQDSYHVGELLPVRNSLAQKGVLASSCFQHSSLLSCSGRCWRGPASKLQSSIVRISGILVGRHFAHWRSIRSVHANTPVRGGGQKARHTSSCTSSPIYLRIDMRG